MQGYFAGTPDPNPGTEALDPSGDGLGSIPASADAGYDAAPTEAPIPTSPMALENDTAVQVSPGYEAELAQSAGGYTSDIGSSSGSSTTGSATIPTSPSLQQAALQRVLTGQMGNRTTDVEIGGGKITGREIIPGRGQIQFAMYNAKQFERPSGHYTVQTSRDGEQWYKVAKVKEDITKAKLLVVDEAWQIIGASSNSLAANYIFEAVKTIRGYGGAPLIATQDISDFFALEDGKYGRGILNNCKIKIILNLEEDEAQLVQKVLKLTDAEIDLITRFERGNALISTNSNHVTVAIRCSQMEQELITTDREELRLIVERELKKKSNQEEASL